jgi:hypothetical protein
MICALPPASDDHEAVTVVAGVAGSVYVCSTTTPQATLPSAVRY